MVNKGGENQGKSGPVSLSVCMTNRKYSVDQSHNIDLQSVTIISIKYLRRHGIRSTEVKVIPLDSSRMFENKVAAARSYIKPLRDSPTNCDAITASSAIPSRLCE